MCTALQRAEEGREGWRSWERVKKIPGGQLGAQVSMPGELGCVECEMLMGFRVGIGRQLWRRVDSPESGIEGKVWESLAGTLGRAHVRGELAKRVLEGRGWGLDEGL